MYVECVSCGKQVHVQAVCTADVWPAGWQIVLNRDGEHWFCGHTCATVWHSMKARYQAPSALEEQPETSAPTLFLAGLVANARGRAC